MKLASLLFQNSGEGMMVTDANGLILTVNPAFSLLSGYTEKELIGHRAYELASSRNDREFFDRIFEAVTDSGHWKGELWHQSKNGEEYLVSWWSTPSTTKRANRSATSHCSAISRRKKPPKS